MTHRTMFLDAHETTKRPGFSSWSLWAVLLTYAVAMCGTTMPTPLYPMLQDIHEMSTAVSTQLFAIYALTVLLVLCCFGSLSDAIGRRPILWLGLAASALSGVLYAAATDVPMLFLARTLSGICAGLVTGTATAYLTDIVQSPSRGASVSSIANMVGLGSGPIFAAYLTFLMPTFQMIAFVSHSVLSVGCALLLMMVPESVQTRRKLRLTLPIIPRPALRDYAIGGLMTLGFAVMGGCTAITSILIVRAFGITDLRLLGLIGSLIFAATTMGQKLGGRFVAQHIPLGYLGLGAGSLLIGTAPLLGSGVSMVSYLVGLFIAGFSHGALFPVGLSIVLRRIPVDGRGSASSAFWVLGYALTAAGAMGLGWVGTWTDESTAVLWFGIIIALCSVAAAVLHPRLVAGTKMRAA